MQSMECTMVFRMSGISVESSSYTTKIHILFEIKEIRFFLSRCYFFDFNVILTFVRKKTFLFWEKASNLKFKHIFGKSPKIKSTFLFHWIFPFVFKYFMNYCHTWTLINFNNYHISINFNIILVVAFSLCICFFPELRNEKKKKNEGKEP